MSGCAPRRRWANLSVVPFPPPLRHWLLAVVALSTVSTVGARELVDQTGRHVSLPDHAHRLVSLAPSITETLYALGLAGRLVGDTDYCDYPPAARAKPHVGAPLNPSLERIVALRPDLVLGTDQANRRETADQLERLGIPLYGVTANTVEGTLRSIADLGGALEWQRPAEALVASLRARVAAVQHQPRPQPRPKVLFAVWVHPLITVGRATFISDVIRCAGGVSVSDDLEGEWPHMQLEEVLARSPDIILFPRVGGFGPPPGELERLPGWRDLAAVKRHRLYSVSEAIMRTSPRLIDALEEVARIMKSEK